MAINLSTFLTNSQNSNIQFTEDKFDLEHYRRLCKYCSDTEEQFLTWWNPDKFDWNDGIVYLIIHCSKYIHIWWDAKRFDWKAEKVFFEEFILKLLPEKEVIRCKLLGYF